MIKRNLKWLSLAVLTIVTSGCMHPPPPPKSGPDMDAFSLDTRRILSSGSGLAAGEKVCLTLRAPTKDQEVLAKTTQIVAQVLIDAGHEVVQQGCLTTVEVTLANSQIKHKGRVSQFAVAEAMAQSMQPTKGIVVAEGSIKDKGRDSSSRVFDMTPFTMVNQTLSTGAGSVNAAVGAAGLGLLLDATGAHSWLNNKIAGDPRGYCGGMYCRFWDHYFTTMRFQALFRRTGQPDAWKVSDLTVVSRQPVVDKVFTVAWSDFTRSAVGRPLVAMEILLPDQLVGTWDNVTYVGSEAILTSNGKVFHGDAAVNYK